MGRLYTRGKHRTYWADYVHPATGKRYQRSTKTRDKKVAAERLREWELSATPDARGKRQRLSEAIDVVIATMHDKAEGTIEMYEQKKARIGKTLGDPYVHDIDRNMLKEYVSRRLSDDATHGTASPHTVQKELIVIRRALQEAADSGVLSAMPALPKFAPKYKPRELWLTEEQFGKLLAEFEPHRRLWVGLATLAGASAGEVERCEWKSTRLVEGTIRVPGTKRESRDRWVPIAPMLYALLDEVPPGKRKGLLVEPWGNVRRDLHAACKRAGVPAVSPNDLRRTFASWLVQAGVDLFRVSKLMGHTSTKMVEKVYGKLAKQNLVDAIAAVPAFQVSATRALPRGDE